MSERKLPTWSGYLDPIGMVATLPLALFSERFPEVVSGIVIAILGMLWLLRVCRRNGRIVSDYLTLPMFAIVLLFVPLSLWVSPLPQVTLARTTLLLWGLGLFSWIANDTGEDRWKLVTWVRLFIVFGAVTAVIGLLGMRSDTLIPGFLHWLPEALTYRGGVPSNELGGALLVFFAPILGLIFVPKKLLPVPRWSLVLVFVLMAVALIATKSRGGMLGGALSVFVLAGLLGTQRVLIAVLIAGVAAVCGVLALWSDPAIRIFLLGGTLQGASLDTFFSGRFSIWEEAALVIGDTPLTGIGLGTFGAIMDASFPVAAGPRQLEDAHQQFLQAGTDFGAAGAVCWGGLWAGILVMLVKLRLRLRGGKLPRYVAGGLLAALSGFLLFNLVDSVSPGWAGQIGFWFLAGLTVRMRRQVMGKTASRGWMAKGLVPVIAGALLAVVLVFAGGGGMSGNKLGVQLHRQLLDPGFAAPDVPDNARANFLWLSGLAKYRAGDEAAGERLWLQLASKSPRHWRFMQSIRPRDVKLAGAALSAGAENAEAHFWLAASLEESDPERSIALLRSGLVLDPAAGAEWLRLGDAMTKHNGEASLEEAMGAYGNACSNGDPGANGCVRAGRIAEQLGRATEALHYYQQSNWEVGRKRALELDPASAERPAMAYAWGVLALLLAGLAGWLVRVGG
ncbi:MAG: O-antigen ligase family protein [Verrucomicrobiales bacterium]